MTHMLTATCHRCGASLPIGKTSYCSRSCQSSAKAQRWAERCQQRGILVVPVRAGKLHYEGWRKWRDGMTT